MPVGVPLLTLAFSMLTSELPSTRTPVAFGPVPPATKVSGLSMSPIRMPVEPPVTWMPTALPDVRATPWAVIPLMLELLTPSTVTGVVVALPKIVVTSEGPKSLKSCFQPPVMSMSDASEIGSL